MAVTPATRPERPRWRPVVLACGLWGLVVLGLVATAWLDHLLRRAGRPDLAERGAPVPSALAALSAATVGVVVAVRRPSHPVGWLLLGLGLSLPWSDGLDAYVQYGELARPGSLPAARYLAVYSPAVFMAGLACAGFVLLLTPSGSLPSPWRRWRWWARALGAAPVAFLATVALLPEPLDPAYASIANPLGLPGGLPVQVPLIVVNLLAGAVVLLTVPVATVSLTVRFRRARGLERQELRWLAFAAGLASVGALLVLAGTSLPTGTGLTLTLITWGAGLCLVLLPLAIGAAILRYRLYDLDRIISRTLAYGLLTLLLGGGYAGIVLGLGRFAGRDSSLAVAAATLAVAALFQPARRRIQAGVDRRFNRRRHDAAQTIATFHARLRDQVDLDTLSSELLAVVDQTMQPTRTSLWLRPRGPSTATDGTAALPSTGTN
jgi:hypothetical protein